MQPSTPQDYKTIITEVIQKQIAILGSSITLSKARSVTGLTIDDSGTVTDITGDPQVVMQALVDQFVQLSGLIVRKTMESLLTFSPTSEKTSEFPISNFQFPNKNPQTTQAPEQPMAVPTANEETQPQIHPSIQPYIAPSTPPAPVLDNPTPNTPELNKGTRNEEIQKIIDEALRQK